MTVTGAELSLRALEEIGALTPVGLRLTDPELALEPDLAAGRLVALPLKGVDIERSLIAIRRPGGRPHDGAKRFWAWLPSVD